MRFEVSKRTYSFLMSLLGLGSLVAATVWPAAAAELKMAGIGLLGLAAPRPDMGAKDRDSKTPEPPQ